MFYVCLFLIIVIIGGFFYLNNIINDKQKKIFILTKDNDNLRKKLKTLDSPETLNVTFLDSDYKVCEVNSNSCLYIAPLISSSKLCTFETCQRGYVLCKCEIKNELWYEIDLNTSSKLNTHGWVKATSVTFIENSLLNI